MYDDVRKAESPTASLLEFCESAYEAAATLGNWTAVRLKGSCTGRRRSIEGESPTGILKLERNHETNIL